VFTVTGAGDDIWDSSDQFRFVYQSVTGDTQIIARVASLQGVRAWSKAGVMIRGSLTGPSAYAMLAVTPEKGWAFQRRQYDGSSSLITEQEGVAPGWVRLVREGSLITAYHSADGSTWMLLGTETVQMGATVYVGLAITSQDASATATAVFTNVAIEAPSTANAPPTVSLVAPSAGSSFAVLGTMHLSAAAADSDGIVNRVHFFANNVWIGASTAAPFSLMWTNVAAGTYTLIAIATDNGGGATASAPVVVAVNRIEDGATPTPPAESSDTVPTGLAFAPSTDHDTAVTSYVVELRRGTDGLTAAPIATRDVGKPAPVNGEIIVDISTLVHPLATGSYYAVVVASGPGGASGSDPSPLFTK